MSFTIRRALAAVGATLAVVTASTFMGQAAGAIVPAVDSSSSTLKACYNLGALTSHDRLFSGPYTLTVFPEQVELTQDVVFSGELSVGYVALNWMKSNPNPPARATDQTYLALHCNGDLALRRSNGTLLWHSNTANRGASRLALTTGGNLLLLNEAGTVVWQAGTGSSTLPANSILPSNRKLTSDRNVEAFGVRDSLSMQTDGNLVYRKNAKVVWQSNTHVQGSRAGLTTRGQLAVITPDGRYIWSSRPTGSRHSVLDIGMAEIDDLDKGLVPIWSFTS